MLLLLCFIQFFLFKLRCWYWIFCVNKSVRFCSWLHVITSLIGRLATVLNERAVLNVLLIPFRAYVMNPMCTAVGSSCCYCCCNWRFCCCYTAAAKATAASSSCMDINIWSSEWMLLLDDVIPSDGFAIEVKQFEAASLILIRIKRSNTQARNKTPRQRRLRTTEKHQGGRLESSRQLQLGGRSHQDNKSWADEVIETNAAEQIRSSR